LKASKNIHFYLIIIVLIWIASFLLLGKGQIVNFFSKIINPEIKEEEYNHRFGDNDCSEKSENLSKSEFVINKDSTVEVLSEMFVKSSFAKEEENIKSILSEKTSYIKSPDDSSFLRCVDGEQHVEGYMATDKILNGFRQKWAYIEGDEAIVGMEILLEGEKAPLLWCLYYKKVNGVWKLYMLENE